MMITKVDSKTFIGKNIIHVAVFKKKDKRTIYNMIYRDGKGGASYVKRFAVTSITRDKEYDLSNGTANSQVYYFSANPNGEAELVTILLRQSGSVKKLKWDLDFAEIIIKGRSSKGNLVTKHSLKRIELKEKGVSTLKPRKIWFDDTVQRINVDERGDLVGEFRGEDRILIITQKGIVKTIIPEITARFDDDMIVMEKWIPKKPISAVYFDGEKERFFVKRFLIENESKEESFITNHVKSHLEIISTDWKPVADIEFTKERGKERKDNLQIELESFITIKGIHALGNQLSKEKVKQINLLDPIPFEAPKELPADEIEVVDETLVTQADILIENSKEATTTQQSNKKANTDSSKDDEGQITLF
jgi:topoisomerase-4 subunit A